MYGVRTISASIRFAKRFFNLMVEEGFVDDSEKCLIFHDSFLEINPRF